MTKVTFALNDPALAKRKAERIAVIRARVEQALSKEKCTLPEMEVKALSEAAWRYESGGLPNLRPMAERAYREIHNRVAKDSRKIRAALDALGNAIEESCNQTWFDLTCALDEAGITADEANRVLTALHAIAAKMATEPEIRTKQGNTAKPLATWALAMWPALDRRGLEMRKSARVLAAALDGDDQSIYQTIRNSLSGKKFSA
ncbi:MAG: hypothetical protein KJZ92_04895 [Rhodocyclaceae bacterium]|nr:hypothetical protein [Rhodocyclaceae bacterium]